MVPSDLMTARIRQVLSVARTVAGGELGRYGVSPGKARVDRFEADLCRSFGTPHARAVNSGTNALIACLAALRVGPGDEVLVPAYTWVSSAAAAVAVGAVPILVEIDESLTMDPADLEAKITPRTKAIVPVHMLNLPADLDTVLAIGARHDIPVLEDACQGVGVSYHGKRLGTMGAMGAYSFNQHKNIRSGEGGAFVTADTELFDRASMYHDVGSYERPGADFDDEVFVGMNMRMPELAAAVLRPQLADIDKQMDKRAKRTEIYADAMASCTAGRVARHNDPEAAVALTVIFDEVEVATRFAREIGLLRLIDSGRHVYSNWASILGKRTFDDRVNPWRGTEIDYVDSCPNTTDILERSVHIATGPSSPLPIVHRRARAIAAWTA